MGGDGGHVGAVGLGHGGGGGGVLAGVTFTSLPSFSRKAVHWLMAWGWEKISLMSSSLVPFFGHQVVVHLQPGGADDLKAAVAEHQVIDLLDGAAKLFSRGEHAVVAEAVLDGGKRRSKLPKYITWGCLNIFSQASWE